MTVAPPDDLDLASLVHLEDFQRLASQRLPDHIRLLVDNNENNGNVEAWQRWALNQRALVDVSHIDTTTTVLGRRIALPVVVAPFALQSFCHPDAEVATARGAARAGTTMGVSLATTRSYQEIGAALDGFWVHLTFFDDREFMLELINEAAAAGARAVCLTVDMPTGAWWPTAERLAMKEMSATHEGYLSRRLTNRVLAPHGTAVNGDDRGWESRRPIGASATWDDLDRLRDVSPLPLILKGILTAADARLAVQHGVAAIVVSNHGGHALVEARPTAEALPDIAEAVDGALEVLVDGGIRGAADIIRAKALGARAVLIGRRALWGLTLGGADGVDLVLRLLRDELEIVMGLVGMRTIDEIDRSVVVERLTPVTRRR